MSADVETSGEAVVKTSDTDTLTDGEVAGIAIGSVIGTFLLGLIILYAIKIWMQGPTKGSDINVSLENKVVAITGSMIPPNNFSIYCALNGE